jgi:hypothetical protein
MAFVVALKQRLSIEQTAVVLGLNTKPSGGQLPKLQGRRRTCDRHHAGEGIVLLLSRQEGRRCNRVKRTPRP